MLEASQRRNASHKESIMGAMKTKKAESHRSRLSAVSDQQAFLEAES
jgi:hypothetical protein